MFGQAGTPYDFESIGDMNQLREQAQNLEAQKDAKKKKVNPKVMNMIEEYVFAWPLLFIIY